MAISANHSCKQRWTMLIHVELAALRRDWGLRAALGPTEDARCVLHTSEVHGGHAFADVRVRSGAVEGGDGGRVVPAMIRPTAESGRRNNAITPGLQSALGLSSAQYSDDKLLELEVLIDESNAPAKGRCTCSMGSIRRIKVRFTDRPTPTRTILGGIRTATQRLLMEQVMFPGQEMLITWFHRPERLRVVDIDFERIGTGCMAKLGQLGQESTVEIEFQAVESASIATGGIRQVDECLAVVEGRLGGVREPAERLIQAIRNRCRVGDQVPRRNVSYVGGILSGLAGIGKTALAKAVCDSLGLTVRYLNAADVFQTFVGHSEAQIVRTFENLVQHAPSILVVDGLESVAASRQAFVDSQSPLEVGVLGTFLSCLEKLKHSNAPVFVLGTTSRFDDIDAAVYTNGRMDLVIGMEPPTQLQRHEILNVLTRNWALDRERGEVLQRLSESTGGYVGADLLSVCQKALQFCLNDYPSRRQSTPVTQLRHFEQALNISYPSVLQSHHTIIHQQISNQNDSSHNVFDNVYGLEDALQALRVSLFEPLEDCGRFLKFGAMPPKGILLTGPPGSGKTHLAHAVSAELRRRGLASFVSVRCTDLLTKVVGDTEKSLRELFDTARSAAPCVLYFDQIESIAPVRGFDTSTEQTFDRLLSMLLVEMDGFSTTRERLQESTDNDQARSNFLKQHVVILASTERKTSLDPAILRPGRFDVHIQLKLPDEQARVKLIVNCMDGIPLDFDSSPNGLTSAQLLAEHIAERTEGLSAGDLRALFREAAMASLRDNVHATKVDVRIVMDLLDLKPPNRSHIEPTPHLGDRLHPRNRYRGSPPDFYALGQRYPSFRQYLQNVDDAKKTASLAFDDPYAVRELTRTLLRHDFGLDWTIPIDRLCPPIPNRLNYIHWIEDLLQCLGIDPFGAVNNGESKPKGIRGIDIGTGANCIYPLLGAKTNAWSFVATEIDESSFESAQANVDRNCLASLISVQRVSTSRVLLEPLASISDTCNFQFSMCNPPFFGDMDEADTNPDTSCMGSSSEMVCPGGEVAFIGAMIEDSIVLKDRVVLYSSMIGRKSSLRKVLSILRQRGISNVCSTEFCQGRTKRWGIAWTFDETKSFEGEEKTLGKRKEARRRNELSFEVPIWSSSTDHGCRTLAEVVDRVHAHASYVNGVDSTTQDVEMSDRTGTERETRLTIRRCATTTTDNAFADPSTTELVFEGNIHCSQEVGGAFRVDVDFRRGQRDEFWRFVDGLKAATVQSGRQWRRKRAKSAAEGTVAPATKVETKHD